MPEGARSILPLPKQKIARQLCPNVASDHIRGREVAGPLFDAGGTMLCLAQKHKYRGDLHPSENHWFHLVLQGKMKFRLNDETFTVGPGHLVCTPAGTMTQRSGVGPVSWIYVILDDTPMWEPLKNIGPSVRKYESADLMYILTRQILAANRSQDIYSLQCARENAAMLVTLLKRELRQSGNEWTSKHMARLVNLLDRIRKDPSEDWNRKTMADMVNMSERNLSRTFQRVFNMPPATMVMTIRMELAGKLLRNTDTKLADIAAAVGYESTFSFSRLFAKYVGTAPGKYRNQNR